MLPCVPFPVMNADLIREPDRPQIGTRDQFQFQFGVFAGVIADFIADDEAFFLLRRELDPANRDRNMAEAVIVAELVPPWMGNEFIGLGPYGNAAHPSRAARSRPAA